MSLRVSLLLILLLSLTFEQSKAQNMRKAQRYWDNQDWPGLISELETALTKEGEAAGEKYLYSRLYTHAEGYPQQLDSALYWIRAAMRSWPLHDAREQSRYERFGVTQAQFQAQKRWIDSVGYAQTREVDTEVAYQAFITRHFDAPQHDQALERLYQKAFEKAESEDSYRAYATFVNDYPQAPQVPEAIQRAEDAAYEEETADGKVASYQRFIARHPKSPYRPQAEFALLQRSTLSFTPDELGNYIQAYPKAAVRHQVVSLLYHLHQGQQQGTEWLATITQWPEWDSLVQAHQGWGGRLYPMWEDKVGYRLWEPAKERFLTPVYQEVPDSVCHTGWPHAWLPNLVGPEQYRIETRAGAPIFQETAQSARDLGYGFLGWKKNDLWGIAHVGGFMLMEPSFTDVQRVHRYALAGLTSQGWRLYSALGLPSSLPPVDELLVQGGHLLLRKGDVWAVMPLAEVPNSYGQAAPELSFVWEEFEYVPMTGELILFGESGEALMSASGQLVIPQNAWSLEEVGFGWVAESALGYGFVLRGQPHMSTTLYEGMQHSRGWLALKLNGRWALLHPESGFDPKFEYDSVRVLGEDIFYLQQGDSRRLQLANGQSLVVQPQELLQALGAPGEGARYDWVRRVAGDSAYVINARGELIWKGLKTISTERLDARHLRLRQQNKFGIWSADSGLVVPITYAGVGQAQGGLIPLLQNELFGAYWIERDTVLESRWERVPTLYADTLLIGYAEGKMGVFSSRGNTLLPSEYDEIRYWNDTAALCRTGDLWEIVNLSDGEILLSEMRQVQARGNGEYRILTEFGYGLIHPLRGELIHPELESLEWVGDPESPVGYWRGENFVPAAGWMIFTYFDRYGRRLHRQVVDEQNLDKAYCE